jgi:acetyl esterase/lipase
MGPRLMTCIATLFVAFTAWTVAQGPAPAKVVPLWPEGVPGAIANAGPERTLEGDRIENVHIPTLTVYPAASTSSTGTAVVVCPGGGYRRLAFGHEGKAVAEWLNSLGVSAFVLKYRLQEYGHPAPLRDVLRAIRLVRSTAGQWGIDPGRIGVLGFSAGGHLASTAGTLFDAPEGRTGAALDEVSARPDFLVLVYPVIALEGPAAHAGSRESLLGKSAPSALVESLSTYRRVTARTPPTFLVHGGNDQTVPVDNSQLFYSALKRAGVPAEMHLYEEGPHGIGLQPGHGPMSYWKDRCAEWMRARGLLSRGPGG